MRRTRNLALFAALVLVIVIGLAWTFRGKVLPLVGVSLDTGAGGRCPGCFGSWKPERAAGRS